MSDIIKWRSRGLGLDETPGCFVCGAIWKNDDSRQRGNTYLNNVAAILSPEDEGAALACFDRGARMAYWHGRRDVPQIKVGACDAHLPVLNTLAEQWFISRDSIMEYIRPFQPSEAPT